MSEDLTVIGESLLPDSSMCDACGEKLRFLGKKVCPRCHNHFCSKCLTLPPPPFLPHYHQHHHHHHHHSHAHQRSHTPSTAPTPTTASSRHQHSCKACLLLDLELIERSHLGELTIIDLRYYARRKSYSLPVNHVVKEEVVDFILSKQAGELAERAQRAMRQVSVSFQEGEGAAFLSAYSMTGKDIPQGRSTPRDPGRAAGRGGVDSGDGDMEMGRGGVADTTTSTNATTATSTTETPTATTTVDEQIQRKRARQDIDFSQVSSLDALTEESQIGELSVKQLKLILQRNCINYKGCVEKRELRDKVATLWRSREEDKIRQATIAQMGNVDIESEYQCKVCMDAPVDCVLLECGHMLTCVTCGRQLSECPICRQYVTRVVHAFRV